MKKKKIKADDYFSAGPLEVARFGKNVLMRSNWDPEQFHKFQKSLVERLPQVENEIDDLIRQSVEIIERNDALSLLRRAFWEMAGLHIEMKSEAEGDEATLRSVQTLEYIQNIAASAAQTQRIESEVSEEDWAALTDTISNVYSKVNREFLLSEHAKRKAEGKEDEDIEEFRHRALIHWVNIRGERYSVHEQAHLSDLLLCQSPIVESVLGIGASHLIVEIEKIHRSLIEGVGRAAEDLRELDAECSPELRQLAKSDPNQFESEEAMREAMDTIIAEKGLRARHEDVVGRFFGYDLFDLEKVTSLPRSVLDVLSWEQGEQTSFLSEGEHRGWPLRITPISQRPFLKIRDGYWCFNAFGLLDNLYRIIQRIVFANRPDLKQDWIGRQKENTERLPLRYFDKLLPGNFQLRDVYYRWYPNDGHPKKEWCETDGLVIYGDHLFIFEVKAGSFTYTSPYDDYEAHIRSIDTLVQKPADQGARFASYLDSAESIALFDADKKEIRQISKGDFRKITVCAVTVDPFTEIASQIQHLSPLGVSAEKTPTWSISIDDLRVCSDLFSEPLVFLHYLEKRMEAGRCESVSVSDELDHIGLYFRLNDYARHATELSQELGGEMRFNGYRQEIDEYFHDRLRDGALPSPFYQSVPLYIRKIIEFCGKDRSDAWVSLVSYLLDGSEECRKEVAEGIEHAVHNQELRKRLQVVSTTGEFRITVACWQPHFFKPDPEFLREHAKTELVCHDEPDRRILEIFFDSSNKIDRLSWSSVRPADIPSERRGFYLREAEEIRARRVRQTKNQRRGKLSRNAPCPCGSGLKFKKCCLS